LSMALEYIHTGGVVLGVDENGEELGVGMHTVYKSTGWVEAHAPWIPVPTAEALIKAGVLTEGKHFIDNSFLFQGGAPRLWVIQGGKAEPTGHAYDADKGVFSKPGSGNGWDA